MIKEKSMKINLDKYGFYALLDKLHNKDITVTLSYDVRSNDFPRISIDNKKLETIIDTSSESPLIEGNFYGIKS